MNISEIENFVIRTNIVEAHRIQIKLIYCSPGHNETNGQVQRVHSTIIEMKRC